MTTTPSGSGSIRRAVARLAGLVPPVRSHLERDKKRAHDLADATRTLRLASRDRDALAAAAAARAGGDQSALPIGDDVLLRPQGPLTTEERAIVDAFHDLYYMRWKSGSDTINVSWLGWPALKCPLDLWVYQELIVRQRPEVIVETGTRLGGSAYFLASILDLVGSGEVVTVDIKAHPGLPSHPRIRYLTGSSSTEEVRATIGEIVDGRRCLVILDSDHSRDHVLAELRLYASLVSVGSYVIVEDTNVNGHPTLPDFGPGPWEAVEAFLAEDDRFERDTDMERFLLTLNPGGYLRRVR